VLAQARRRGKSSGVQVSKHIRRGALLALLAIGLFQPLITSTALLGATAPVTSVQETNYVATTNFARNGARVNPPVKKKAAFLAGAGLAIMTLLGLAVALALVRTFKR